MVRHRPSVYLAADIPEGSTEVKILGGESLPIVNQDGLIRTVLPASGEARVVRAEIQAVNGVVQAINEVITTAERVVPRYLNDSTIRSNTLA
ncbi:hypothetical protein [Lewinella sp. IMCC34183]|uniref:hypothetical protein n=1 Tax=Lewinella sp. IMCC34183 TaxID=2248762 RepID=UPI000E2886B6|nr:hypothetical protein [Lewinella sp. IMCC34183]